MEDNKKTIDLTYLKQFAGGDKDFMKKMINMFTEKGPESVKKMEEELEAKNWAGLKAASHKMKSSVDIVGSKELKENLVKIEDYATEQTNLDQLSQLVQNVKQICDTAIIELKEESEKL